MKECDKLSLLKNLIFVTLIFIVIAMTSLNTSASERTAQCVYFETAVFQGDKFYIQDCNGKTIEFRKKVKGELSL